MYLVSLYEKEAILEASLGGRVTADEIRVLGEELEELLEAFENRPFQMLVDHSKAKRLDVAAVVALGEVKDQCLAAGATRIVSVPIDENDLVSHQSARLQQVLEGTEEFVTDLARVRFAPAAVQAQRRAA